MSYLGARLCTRMDQDAQNYAVLRKLLFFSGAMAVIPLGLFYAIQSGVVDPVLAMVAPHFAVGWRPYIGGIAAVIAVDCIVASYVYAAFNEQFPTQQSQQEQQADRKQQ